jgi:hypothetical protein
MVSASCPRRIISTSVEAAALSDRIARWHPDSTTKLHIRKMCEPVKKLLLAAAALAVLILPAGAFANTITFSAPVTASNTSSSSNNPNSGSYQGGANQFNLDHTQAYTWRINNVAIPTGQTITGATLTFTNMRNWDSNANMLFVHMFDTALNAGVASYHDASGVPVTNIFDNFSTTNPLVTNGTGNTLLGSHSFTNTAVSTWTITFNQQELTALAAYIANGHDLAFGFDPDCHFWNNGINFSINTATAVPEPVSIALLGTGLAGLYLRRRRQQKGPQSK